MVSFAKLYIIRQGIRKIYKNIGLEKFLLSNKLLQDEYFNDEELEYKGPFEDWSKKKYKLPEIERLEIFNIPDYEYDDVMQFIYKMSPSLKFLILKRSRVSATDFMKVLRRADKLEKTDVNVSTRIIDVDYLDTINSNLKKLELHFDKLDDELFNQIFSAVPNVKKLMLNVPKDTVQKIIKNGKLANVENSEYVEEHWIFPTFVRANKKFNDINCSCHRLFTRDDDTGYGGFEKSCCESMY
jgi:hypothetical protein